MVIHLLRQNLFLRHLRYAHKSCPIVRTFMRNGATKSAMSTKQSKIHLLRQHFPKTRKHLLGFCPRRIILHLHVSVRMLRQHTKKGIPKPFSLKMPLNQPLIHCSSFAPEYRSPFRHVLSLSQRFSNSFHSCSL